MNLKNGEKMSRLKLPILFYLFIGLLLLLSVLSFFISSDEKNIEKESEPENIEFGFDINKFKVKRDTIEFGDSFGEIMEKNKIGNFNLFIFSPFLKFIFRPQVREKYSFLIFRMHVFMPITSTS